MADKPATSKKKFGPDAEFWHGLKGKAVRIHLTCGEVLHGTLAWVDFYSVGVDVERVSVPDVVGMTATKRAEPGRSLIFKHAISMVRAA